MRESPSLAASNAGAGEGEACEVVKYASGRGNLCPASFNSLPTECQDLKEFLQTEGTHRREGAGREGGREGGREEGRKEGEEGRNQSD